MQPLISFCCPLCGWSSNGAESSASLAQDDLAELFVDHGHQEHDLEAQDAIHLLNRASRPERSPLW